MTDRDTLLALAVRVEGLSNPDREVDLDIYRLISGKKFRWAEFGGAHPDQRQIAVEDLPEHFASDPFWIDRAEIIKTPAYTASLDAAKTLVPKGWHVGMLTECDEDDSPSCCLTQNEDPCRDAVGRGADMALSLVAASLRARAGGL